MGAFGRALLLGLASVTMLAVASATASIATIPARDYPFMALPSADGSAIFVSVVRKNASNGVLVLHRDGSSYRSGRFIDVDGFPEGMALTPDGTTLLIASGDRYAALDARAAARDEKPQLSYLQDRFTGGAIEVTPTADGRFAFFTDEDEDSLDLVRIDSGPGGATLSRVSRISTDDAPVGTALSPDGKYLYVTSESAAGKPRVCNGYPEGSLAVVDVALARSDPSHATVSSVAAGCSPVRAAVSPEGKLVWVTVREGDRLAAFDAALLRSAPEHALRALVKVGTSPVGIALARGGWLVYVANSARFEGSSNAMPARNFNPRIPGDRALARQRDSFEVLPDSTVSVIDAAKALAGEPATVATYHVGAFPRELRESPQHDAVYVTNYSSGTVDALPLPNP